MTTNLDPDLKFKREFITMLVAGTQAIKIDTPELARAERLIEEAVKGLATGAEEGVTGLYTWDVLKQFVAVKKLEGLDLKGVSGRNGLEALTAVQQKSFLPNNATGTVVVIFRNIHLTLTPEFGARICQLIQTGVTEEEFNSTDEADRPTAVVPVFLSDSGVLPAALDRVLLPLELPLPSIAHIEAEYDFVAKTRKRFQAAVGPESLAQIRRHACRLMLGLPMSQVTNALSRAAVELNDRFFSTDLLDTLELAKRDLLKTCSALEYVPKAAINELGNVGGFDYFKQWLADRQLCYSDEAARLKIDKPKGCVMVGFPGTGKTRIGKLTAILMRLPLLSLDVGAIFQSQVGGSEQTMRTVLRTLEAIGPCVLMLDEAEKALAGTDSDSPTGDSGVGKRVFGSLLSWLSSNNHGVFVMVTMNRTKGIPAEFLRKGRFDEIFNVGLPSAEERIEIAKIHLRNRGVEPGVVFGCPQDEDDFVKASGGTGERFTGAEIETAVVAARLRAFADRGNGVPTIKEICNELSAIIPLADDAVLLKEFKDAGKHFKSVSIKAAAPKGERRRRIGEG